MIKDRIKEQYNPYAQLLKPSAAPTSTPLTRVLGNNPSINGPTNTNQLAANFGVNRGGVLPPGGQVNNIAGKGQSEKAWTGAGGCACGNPGCGASGKSDSNSVSQFGNSSQNGLAQANNDRTIQNQTIDNRNF